MIVTVAASELLSVGELEVLVIVEFEALTGPAIKFTAAVCVMA